MRRCFLAPMPRGRKITWVLLSGLYNLMLMENSLGEGPKKMQARGMIISLRKRQENVEHG